METLARLEPGQIAEPIDSMFGFQVLKRTQNRPRKHYAMAELELTFDPGARPGHASSKAAVLQRAQSFAAALRHDPSRFSALQKEYCCTAPVRVIEGRDLPALEAVLDQLAPGQIAEHPVEDPAVEYLIPKRLELGALPEIEPPRFELPSASPGSRQERQ